MEANSPISTKPSLAQEFFQPAYLRKENNNLSKCSRIIITPIVALPYCVYVCLKKIYLAASKAFSSCCKKSAPKDLSTTGISPKGRISGAPILPGSSATSPQESLSESSSSNSSPRSMGLPKGKDTSSTLHLPGTVQRGSQPTVTLGEEL